MWTGGRTTDPLVPHGPGRTFVVGPTVGRGSGVSGPPLWNRPVNETPDLCRVPTLAFSRRSDPDSKPGSTDTGVGPSLYSLVIHVLRRSPDPSPV